MADAQVLFQQGVQAIKDRDFDDAQRFLKASLRQNPRNPMGWLWLAKITRDETTQRKLLQRGLQYAPEHPQLQTVLERLENPAAFDEPLLTTRTMGIYVVIAMMWASLMLCMGTALLFTLGDYTATFDGQFNGVGILSWLVLNVPVWFVVVVLLRTTWRMATRKFTLSERGIAVQDGADPVAWSRVVGVKTVKRRVSLLRRLTPYVLYANSQTVVKLPDDKTVSVVATVAHYDDARQIILDKTGAALAARDDARIKRGETVEYGRVTADSLGIKQGGVYIGWGTVREIEVRPGFWKDYRIVGYDGSEIVQTFQNVWNAHVLIHLIQRRQ